MAADLRECKSVRIENNWGASAASSVASREVFHASSKTRSSGNAVRLGASAARWSWWKDVDGLAGWHGRPGHCAGEGAQAAWRERLGEDLLDRRPDRAGDLVRGKRRRARPCDGARPAGCG